MQSGHFKPEKPWLLGFVVISLLGGAFVITSFIRDTNTGIFCKASSAMRSAFVSSNTDDLQLQAIRHYATSTIVPQQSFKEISITYDVLRSLGRPANFLVFGLGHDSIMWASLNPRGNTLFLEEDPHWVKTVLKDASFLRAHTVKYRTHLSESDALISSMQFEPSCFAKNAFLRGNTKCKLALDMLPNEVYDTEWDLIMIDAPRGYSAELPGRMSAIFSAAVMARNRKGSGVTHVFLHDVDRVVEKTWGKMILCEKYLVKGVGRLWHFEIPPSTMPTNGFC
ncbi:hypothetical protein Leryth_017984 [Lithospermum erythrorhizon]|nr:hypothetical protein Leryth_017984 [Lithospermum erythrorhizon]